MRRDTIASVRHLGVALLIVGVVTAAGLQAGRASPPGPATDTPRVVPYLTLVALEVLWVRFVRDGLVAKGHHLREIAGPRWTSRTFTVDAVSAAVAFFVAREAASAVAWCFGGPPANTGFLLPHGLAESTLWVAVSIAAGVCEEVVYRGYFQRQFAALSGSAAAGVVLQAALFGASHAYQGVSSIAATASYGIVLGVLVWWRGDVRAAAIAHAATDIVGGLTRF